MDWQPSDDLVAKCCASVWAWEARDVIKTKTILEAAVASGHLIPAEQVRVMDPSRNSSTP